MSDEITMKSKYPGKCYNCGYKFGIGADIIFDKKKRVASHEVCPESDYRGKEQISIFETWVQRAKESESNNG